MEKYIDRTGERYGRWTVLEYCGRDKHRRAMWKCKCDCGKEKIVPGPALKSGDSKSCGCLHDEVSGKRIRNLSLKHGGCSERLYWVWDNMKRRCEDEKSTHYFDYGGRGIKVCEEWQTYAGFREWALKSGYDKSAKKYKCKIDRIDNNGDYCPENCRWANMIVQNNNKRSNRKLDFMGKLLTIPQWSKIVGISKKTIYTRIYRGWSAEDALTVGGKYDTSACISKNEQLKQHPPTETIVTENAHEAKETP